MLARGDLALEADIRSDTAPVNDLVEALLAAAPGTRWLRDPTRGGVGTVCNELAQDANVAIVLDEAAAPGRPRGGRRLRPPGIDPLYVANEGKVVAVVAPDEVDAALAAMRAHPLGASGGRRRRDRRRARGHRRAADHVRRHADRRHARRRPAAADLLRTPCRRRRCPRDRHRAGRRVPAVRVPPCRRARPCRDSCATTAKAC